MSIFQVVYFLVSVYNIEALEIFGSSRNAVVNDSFTITCSGNSSNTLIVLTTKLLGSAIVNFIGSNPDNTCLISGSPVIHYTYRCVNNSNTLSYSTEIPGNYIKEEFHLSNWTCRNPFTNRYASMILHVDVPVTSVTITPVTVEMPVTGTKTIKCETNAGRPAAIIQWFLSDGKNLTASATQQPDCIQTPDNKHKCSSKLTYKGSLMDHGKNIFCEASNVDEISKRSHNVSLYISYGPSSVVLFPFNSSYTVTEATGRVGPIACTADCRPDCTMTWSGPNVPSGQTSVLNLQNINRNKAGYYQCTATNSIGTNKSRTVEVVVNYGPTSVELSPSTPSYTVTEGSGRVGPITCTADCRPNCTMTWSGTNLPSDTSSILNLQNINRNQTGNYSCTAKNDIGSKPSQRLAVLVHYGPSIVMLFPSTPFYTVNETTGRVGPITCTADCRPNCTVTWSGPNLSDGTTSVLNLQNINRNQAGDYLCTASNSVGSQMAGKVTFIVNYDPAILSIEGNTTYHENNTAEFRCHVDSFPESLIQWTFIDGNKNRIISKENNSFYKVNGSVLKVYSMNCLSMGSYRCEADNGIGTTQESVNVTVMCSARINTIEYDILDKIAVREDESLHITVPILAYPIPWLYWQFQKNQYSINLTNEVTNRLSINRHTSSLFIDNMEEENFGTYVIYGVNGIDDENYQIGSFHVVRERNRPSAADTSSSPSFPVGFGTGFGVAVIIFIVIVVIIASIRIKRQRNSRPATSNLYEETGSKFGPANIYNELSQNTKDEKKEQITRRNKTDIQNMYDDVVAYENQVTKSEDQKGQTNGGTCTKIGAGIYMNTEI